jgi:PAS domain S-box-containing protein
MKGKRQNNKFNGIKNTLKSIDFTDPEQTEREIEHLASFPRLNPNPVIEIDQSGAVLFANDATYKILKQLSCDTVQAFFPPDIKEILENVNNDNEVRVFIREVEINGCVFEESIQLLKEKCSARFYIKDITERKLAEQERERLLLELEQRAVELNTVFRVLPYLVSVHGPDGRYLRVNPALVKLFGIDPTEAAREEIARHLKAHFPDGRPLTPENMPSSRALNGETVSNVEYIITDKNGNEHTLLMNALPIKIEGHIYGAVLAQVDITELKKKEIELNKLNRALRALSRSSELMIRAKDEARYMKDVCRIVVADCGYSMAWIGLALYDEGKTIKPVCYSGFDRGYLDTLKLTWADTKRGQGPTGTAVRTGKISSCKNMLTDPNFSPWRKEALKRGYASSIAFPLMSEGRAFAAITIYSREPDPFFEDEITLFSKLADNLAYGIMALRSRITHAMLEKSLTDSHEELNAMIENMPLVMLLLDRDRKIRKMNSAAVDFIRSQDSEIEDRRAGNVMHCINSINSPQGCGLSPDCFNCALRRIITDTFEKGISHKNVEMQFTRKQNDTLKKMTFLVSTTLIHSSNEILCLVCFDDITERKEAELKILSFNDRIKSDLMFAGTLQHSIEPPEVIEESGYAIYSKNIHCEEMAGDYLDIIRIDHFVYIISADVSGHGLIASFFTFIMKAIIKTVLRRPIHPDQLMPIISKEMKKYLVEDYFFTINIMEINIADNLLTYSTAGHPPFIIFNENEIKIFKETSTFISNLIPSRWAGEVVPLSPQDRIFIFTDGIFEVSCENNKILGISYIEEFIKDNRNTPSPLIINKLIQNLKTARKKDTFDDDISVCVFGKQN